MRTRVIPAQITTVEDKVAGNLNFTQIILFIVPIFWSSLVYVTFSPSMALNLYKLALVFVVSIFCFILAIRIKGRIILHWLTILLRFNLRPKYYVFDKNDAFLRRIDLKVFENKRVSFLQNKYFKRKNIQPIF
jgi:hypothetical protein